MRGWNTEGRGRLRVLRGVRLVCGADSPSCAGAAPTGRCDRRAERARGCPPCGARPAALPHPVGTSRGALLPPRTPAPHTDHDVGGAGPGPGPGPGPGHSRTPVVLTHALAAHWSAAATHVNVCWSAAHTERGPRTVMLVCRQHLARGGRGEGGLRWGRAGAGSTCGAGRPGVCAHVWSERRLLAAGATGAAAARVSSWKRRTAAHRHTPPAHAGSQPAARRPPPSAAPPNTQPPASA